MALRIGLVLLASVLALGCGEGEGGDGLVSGGGSLGGGGADGGATSSGSGTSGNPVGSTSSTTTGGVSTTTGSDDCPEITVDAARAIPDMLIVLDRSGSMDDDDGGNVSRWDGSVDAINAVTSQLESTIKFGLMTFPGRTDLGGMTPSECAAVQDQNLCLSCYRANYCGFSLSLDALACLADATYCDAVDPDVCSPCAEALDPICQPAGLDVPLGLNNSMPIADRLAMLSPNGATPTAASLMEARNVLAQTEGNMVGEFEIQSKYVMLVTDGDPNCYSSTGGGGAADDAAQQATIEEVRQLAAEGVLTYVIGYNTAGSDFASVLDQAAQAGGTGDMQHRSVSNGDELIAEFQSIAGRAASCSFVLATPQNEARITITVDGVEAPYGTDWDLRDDGQTVDLKGEACAALQDGASVKADVACEDIRVL